MGWAAGFRTGSDVARQAIDTYRQAQLSRDIEAAQGLTPQEIRAPGATQQQVDAARAETDALAAQDAQMFGLEQPMAYRAPEVGQATAPSRFKLGNQTFDTAPTDAQVGAARQRGVLDAVTRFDPVQGMRMGLDVQRGEREALDFQNRQDDRTKAQNLEASRREYYKSLMDTKDGDKLADMLGGAFSRDGSGVDAMLTFDEKSNKFLFSSRVPGMPSRTLDRAELLNMAMGVWEQGNGDFNRGMQMVLDGVREQRRLGEQDRTDATNLAKGNAELYWKDRNFRLDADYKLGSLANDRARVGIAREGLGLRKQEVDNANWQLIGTSDDGAGLLRYNRNTGAVVTQPLPQGVDAKSVWGKITGQKPDIGVDKVYEQLVCAQIPGQKKGVTYTPEQALQEARRVVAGQQDPFMVRLDALLGGGADPFADKPDNRGIRKPTPAPAPTPTPAPTPAPAPARQTSRPASQEWFNRTQAELSAINEAVAQAEAQAQAAARSGDRNAIIQYGNRLNDLRAQQQRLQQAVQPYTR